jgi:hypothetical protein
MALRKPTAHGTAATASTGPLMWSLRELAACKTLAFSSRLHVYQAIKTHQRGVIRDAIEHKTRAGPIYLRNILR